jgi:hypothetical protein
MHQKLKTYIIFFEIKFKKTFKLNFNLARSRKSTCPRAKPFKKINIYIIAF